MEEIWKDIKGYEGLYQASNLGRIRSLDRVVKRRKVGNIYKEGKILKLQKANNGYYVCKLSKENSKPTKCVHRLIAKTFIPNYDKLPCINHKDENRLNNQVDNLEWCTYEYNNKYGTKIERVTKKLTGKKMSEETKGKHRKLMLGNTPYNKGKKRIYLEGGKYVYRCR